MSLLRNVFTLAFVSSAVLHAADDFELPEFEERVQFTPIEATTVSDGTPVKTAPQTTPENAQNSVQNNAPTAEPTVTASTASASPQNSAQNTTATIVQKKIPKNLDRKLRVGIFTDVKELYVSHDGTSYTVIANKGKLKITKAKGKPETAASKNFHQVGRCTNIATNAKLLKSTCYAGDIKITANGNRLTAINSIHVEEYLRGVLPYEIGKLDSSRFSALEAQAIAARTYAYKHFGSRESLGFDIYADTKDQVYRGLVSATTLTDSAVKKTAGIVMTYNGEFIIAYYHSTCGGETETLATWGRENLPYLESKPDTRPDGTPWCSASSYSNWERKFSDREIASLFKQNAKEAKAKITNFTEVESISILDTLKSGRVLTLEVQTDKGTLQVFGDKTRWLFKKAGTILPSSFFRIGHEDGQWIIRGKGFGHGVGMCQMGVRERAAAGQDFATILNHYYPGITLVRFEK